MGFDRVRVVDPYDLKACDQAVKEELAADEPSVIISRRQKELVDGLRSMLGLAAKVTLVAPKSIVRSEGKAVRVIDKRKI